MQQLYARIKRASTYYRSQRNPDRPLFPVAVTSPLRDHYCVHGGPSSQYRTGEVKLYIVDDTGNKVRRW
jgi:hypothetical protein